MAAPTVPVEEIKKVIETGLGKSISEVFDSFNETPLAAASLAQVHRAVLNGKNVVLKVQRPHAEETTREDVEIIRSIIKLAESYSHTVYMLNLSGVLEEFAEQLKHELDFKLESYNILRFARNFKDDKTIHVPEVHQELTTKRLITMEYLDGINVLNVDRLRDEGYDFDKIVQSGISLTFRSVFEFGFFHADPHPGNLFILPGNVIGVVDFGMMADVSWRDRERLAKLIYFLAIKDEKRVARALNALMESESDVIAEELEPRMSAIIRQYSDVPASEMRAAAMVFAMINATLHLGARLRPQLIWVAKTVANIENIAREYKVDFGSIVEFGKPFAAKVLLNKFNPVKQPQEYLYWVDDLIEVLRNLPYDFSMFVKEIRKGKLKIEFEHIGLDPLRQTISRATNRMAIALLATALLLSSSLIVLAKVPPFLFGISTLGFVGYLLAMLLCFILALSILFRSK